MIDEAYVNSACGESQTKSVAYALLRERDEARGAVRELGGKLVAALLQEDEHKLLAAALLQRVHDLGLHRRSIQFCEEPTCKAAFEKLGCVEKRGSAPRLTCPVCGGEAPHIEYRGPRVSRSYQFHLKELRARQYSAEPIEPERSCSSSSAS